MGTGFCGGENRLYSPIGVLETPSRRKEAFVNIVVLVVVVILVIGIFALAAMGASCCLLGRCCRRQQIRRGEDPDAH